MILFHQEYVYLAPFFFSLSIWYYLRLVLMVSIIVFEAFSTSVLSFSHVTRYSISFSRGPAFFLFFLSSTMFLPMPFSMSLTSLVILNFTWALAFLTSSLDDWTMSIFPLHYLSCFYSLYTIFLYLIFTYLFYLPSLTGQTRKTYLVKQVSLVVWYFKSNSGKGVRPMLAQGKRCPTPPGSCLAAFWSTVSIKWRYLMNVITNFYMNMQVATYI